MEQIRIAILPFACLVQDQIPIPNDRSGHEKDNKPITHVGSTVVGPS